MCSSAGQAKPQSCPHPDFKRKKTAIFLSGLNNKKMFTFTANAPAPAGGRHFSSMEKKGRSARLNTQQKAKKWLPSVSQKKNNGLGRCISLVKDDLSIGRIAAGISPAGTIFSVPARYYALT